MKAERQGFTLIELVIGMLVLSIATVLLTSVLFPQSDRAAATLQRVRASELAGSVLNEIWGKAYDENSGFGGVPACNTNCTEEKDFGPDLIDPNDTSGKKETRDEFDDVDDYHSENDYTDPDSTKGYHMLNSSLTYHEAYPGYKLHVSVSSPAGSKISKLITITVTTPAGEEIQFNALRSNY